MREWSGDCGFPWHVLETELNSLVSGAFTPDAAGQLKVLGEDGDALGVDGAEVGVLEQANQVSLRGFLEGHEGGGLNAEVGLHLLGDLADQALEGELADEELGGLLVAADLAESHGARAEAVRLLDPRGGGGGGLHAGGLGGDVLAGSLAAGRLLGDLLGAGHDGYAVGQVRGWDTGREGRVRGSGAGVKWVTGFWDGRGRTPSPEKSTP